ncbi:MAG: CDGSH iron-sulfur domain-containing protein [Verrucomicrobiota bacterium]|nr:CDGSH iron-sulfur domain-containing protein [Verrucomicrobiota bacterium]
MPYIKITKDGPYLVYGVPQMVQETITPDENGVSIRYTQGRSFEIKEIPTALCRCGQSRNAPYCDGTHKQANFDGTESASFEPILEGAEAIEGPNLTLMDNEKYCAFARFCDAGKRVWNLVLDGTPDSDKLAIREACDCPAGRLMMFDQQGKAIEPDHPVSIAVIEDGGLKISGPLWLRGGIRVESEDGRSYEVRNRQTVCRCGYSDNKPFCNGAHASARFHAQTPPEGGEV